MNNFDNSWATSFDTQIEPLILLKIMEERWDGVVCAFNYECHIGVIISFIPSFYLIIKNYFLNSNTSMTYFELYREDK